MRRPFRLFHFDIATENNFGDTLLFPMVKHMFEAYGAGEAFDVYDSRPLRDNVGPALVRYINETADAVLLGGGGLFLSDTNPNKESGWQWRISMDMLEAIEVPIIVYAVGYNRFYNQPEFNPPFTEHVTRTLEKSIFFGLRNSGSIEKVRGYVPAELREKITYQPCPTTLVKEVLPLDHIEQTDEKVIGFQLSHGNRQDPGGHTLDVVVDAAKAVTAELEERGWRIVYTAFTQPEETTLARIGERFEGRELRRIHGSHVLGHGLEDLGDLPMLLGCRGHAQMIPFGLGVLPFSFDVHPKIGYFLTDIGRPEWTADPLDPEFATKLADRIDEAWENRAENRAHLAAKQQEFLGITRDNLRTIYEALGGTHDDLAVPWKNYDVQAWNMARNRFLNEVQRENMGRQIIGLGKDKRALTAKVDAYESEEHFSARDARTAREDIARLRGEVLREKRERELLERRNADLAVRVEKAERREAEVGGGQRPAPKLARKVVRKAKSVVKVVRGGK